MLRWEAKVKLEVKGKDTGFFIIARAVLTIEIVVVFYDYVINYYEQLKSQSKISANNKNFTVSKQINNPSQSKLSKDHSVRKLSQFDLSQ